jgi:hypothetical protein
MRSAWGHLNVALGTRDKRLVHLLRVSLPVRWAGLLTPRVPLGLGLSLFLCICVGVSRATFTY